MLALDCAVQLGDVFLKPLLAPELGPALTALEGLLLDAPLLLLVLSEVEQHRLGPGVRLAALGARTLVHLRTGLVFKNVFNLIDLYDEPSKYCRREIKLINKLQAQLFEKPQHTKSSFYFEALIKMLKIC